jgi:hypothetical protein
MLGSSNMNVVDVIVQAGGHKIKEMGARICICPIAGFIYRSLDPDVMETDGGTQDQECTQCSTEQNPVQTGQNIVGNWPN